MFPLSAFVEEISCFLPDVIEQVNAKHVGDRPAAYRGMENGSWDRAFLLQIINHKRTGGKQVFSSGHWMCLPRETIYS